MKIMINVTNQNLKKKINILEIKNITKIILKNTIKTNKNIGINILFTTNQKMRFFNRKYFSKDHSTDVIAFSYKNKKNNIFNDEKTNYICIGDIIISLDKAKNNSKIYNTNFLNEVYLYIIHGILHIIGFNDIKETDKKIMQKKENELLQKIKKRK